MPENREETHGEFISRMKSEFPNMFRSDQSVVYCKLCDFVVSATKIFLVKHIDSVKHKDAEKRKKTRIPNAKKVNR